MSRLFTLRAMGAMFIALPAIAAAQGNLSTLGFGYPGGQLSTRALGTGGATSEIDPLSTTNPSVLTALGGSVLYFQAEPEYRTLHTSGLTEKSSIARYPIIVASIPLTERFMVGLSASNLLDRSFETRTRVTSPIGSESVSGSNTFKSDGAIADLRLGLGFNATSWLKLGVGAHAITGDNRISNVELFDDSTRFAALVDTATLGYRGSAFSGGFEAILGRQLSLAGSYRRGNSLSLQRGDTTISRAHVPDRVALSVAYLGIRQSTIAIRTAKDSWSNMAGLGSTNVRITDSWDTSIGADILAPPIANREFQLRAGARTRKLPFGTAASAVSEKSISAGAGTFVGRGRGAFDFTVMRASRSAESGVSETAWTLSFGVTVRP